MLKNNGSLLYVDLSSHRIRPRPIDNHLADRFIGGRGLAAALSHNYIPAGCDPLGPGNTLTLCTGLLTGTAAPSSARIHFCGLSPLTGILGSSNAGGFLGADLRSLDVQGVVISGISRGPVYLYIDSQGARLFPADHLWGLDTRQCERRLKAIWKDDKLRVLSIGPAGETCAALACLMIGTHSAAGRTGLGAVMGSKRLKAIVVKGRRCRQTSSAAVKKAVAAYLQPIVTAEMYPILRRYGQSGYVQWCSDMGMLSTQNYQKGVFASAGRICGTALGGRITRRVACYNCPVRCKADVTLAPKGQADDTGPRPEFETIAALGSKCGQPDMDTVLHLSDTCNRLGMDTISAGSSVAFAMELFEAGILTERDTQGMALRWGDGRVQEQLLDQMARRYGFGAVLADGVRAAARRIGKGSERFAMHAKGLELCAYDPRGSMSTALGYAVSERGGDYAYVFANAEYRWDEAAAERNVGHREGADRFSPTAKGRIVRRCSLCSAVIDSLGLCKVAALGIPATFDLVAEARLVSALLGRTVTANALFEAGERIVNLERLFNLRHRRENGPMDTLPDKFLKKFLPDGPAKKSTVQLQVMLSDYYREMGWDAQGRPLAQTLARLDLSDFCQSPRQPVSPLGFN